jgi:hypothetical protein
VPDRFYGQARCKIARGFRRDLKWASPGKSHFIFDDAANSIHLYESDENLNQPVAVTTRAIMQLIKRVPNQPENLLAIIRRLAKVASSVGQLVLSRHGKSSSERGSVMI